ncbi:MULTISPECIES: aldolase/citrate lyase family protein [unclassified Mesorhizobium]|uniref:aldolase/citrate lyase family protein n=1 Tax=unclassified Mesorhizobium TaxID=325217 RepID=UPI0030150FD3
MTALAMIETREALSNIDEILSVDGIDGVYIGPADLSLSLGYEPSLTSGNREVVDGIAMVHRKVQEAGKISGIHCGLGGSFRERFKEGFNFVACGTDFGIWRQGLQPS